MVDNGRDEARRAYLRKYGMAAEKPQRLPDGSPYPPPLEWHGPPESYVVEYEGLGRDEAEFAFELDEPRHRQDGYVVSHREWREFRGRGAVVRWLTWGFKVRYWGALFTQPPRHPVSPSRGRGPSPSPTSATISGSTSPLPVRTASRRAVCV